MAITMRPVKQDDLERLKGNMTAGKKPEGPPAPVRPGGLPLPTADALTEPKNVSEYDPDPDRPNPLDAGQAMSQQQIMGMSQKTLDAMRQVQKEIRSTSRLPERIKGKGKRFAMALAAGLAPEAFEHYRKEAWAKANMVVTQMEKDWEFSSKMMDHLGGMFDDLEPSPQQQKAYFDLVQETRKAGLYQQDMTEDEMTAVLRSHYAEKQEDAQDQKLYGDTLEFMSAEADELTTEMPELRDEYMEFLATAPTDPGKRVLAFGEFNTEMRKKAPGIRSRQALVEIGMKSGMPPPSEDDHESLWSAYEESVRAIAKATQESKATLSYGRAVRAAAGGAVVSPTYPEGSWQRNALEQMETRGQAEMNMYDQKHQALMLKYRDMHDYRTWRNDYLRKKSGKSGLNSADRLTLEYAGDLKSRRNGLIMALETTRADNAQNALMAAIGVPPPAPTPVEVLLQSQIAELDMQIADVAPFVLQVTARKMPPVEEPVAAPAAPGEPGEGEAGMMLPPHDDELFDASIPYDWSASEIPYRYKGKEWPSEKMERLKDLIVQGYAEEGNELTNSELWDQINQAVEKHGNDTVQ